MLLAGGRFSRRKFSLGGISIGLGGVEKITLKLQPDELALVWSLAADQGGGADDGDGGDAGGGVGGLFGGFGGGGGASGGSGGGCARARSRRRRAAWRAGGRRSCTAR